MEKIRKGDQVVVLSGRDKGRRGAVISVLEGTQVLVEANQPGGIIEKEMPLPLCKVALWNPGTKKGDRVGVKRLADGKKVRFFKSNGEMIDA